MLLADSIRKAKRVYLCGNGGSAANAIHIANDLISVGVKAQALTADVATLTAIANDFSYEEIFSRQLKVFGEPGDLLIVLSGSGNSPNVVKALEEAKKIGMRTFGVLGTTECRAGELAETVYSSGSGMQAAEQYQLQIGHEAMLCLRS